jgi:glycosyltransferase involved in cell wall biosynthesis
MLIFKPIKKKIITLCITNYNKEKFLDRAIRSCEAQLEQNFTIEVILVNDGSKNFKRKKYFLEYPNIKILDCKINRGVSYASNLAINSTNSDYFMRVDGDDYLSIRASLILTTFLENNKDYPFVYGDILKIEKKKLNKIIKRNKLENLLEYGAGVMFRTKILKKIKGYNPNIRNCEDYDLVARIIKKFGHGLYLPFPYYKYYKTNMTHLTNLKSRSKSIKIIKKKYEKYL